MLGNPVTQVRKQSRINLHINIHFYQSFLSGAFGPRLLEGTIRSTTGKYLFSNETDVQFKHLKRTKTLIKFILSQMIVTVGCWSQSGSEYFGFGTTCREAIWRLGGAHISQIGIKF